MVRTALRSNARKKNKKTGLTTSLNGSKITTVDNFIRDARPRDIGFKVGAARNKTAQNV